MGIRSYRSMLRGRGVNYLASVSDLMSALLFVFILTLSAAIIQARSATHNAQEAEQRAQREAAQAAAVRTELQTTQDRLQIVENRLEGNAQALASLLGSLKDRLGALNIPIDIDAQRGVMRVPESAVTFRVGSAQLDEDNRRKVTIIGRVLAAELACFQPKQTSVRCQAMNPNGNTLDAVLIEGHTDNLTYRGDKTDRRNRLLSTARSNAVFDVMVVGNQPLEALRNTNGERLFSLSGYGAERPLDGHNHSRPTDDAVNRRIEFRFIMTPPAVSREESVLIRAHQPAPTSSEVDTSTMSGSRK